MTSRNENDGDSTGIAHRFAEIDTSDLPDFYALDRPLERGLWVLWAVKEKLGAKKLTAEEIAAIITDVKEISIDAQSITQSFHRAGDKLHTYEQEGDTYYAIMKPGKESLVVRAKEGFVQLFYFEPGKKYTSKRTLSKNVLAALTGELRIVDPYCGERTLDILRAVGDETVRILTRLENIGQKRANRFLRELKDFRSEYPKVEVRDYPDKDIHDRYIVSADSLIILGHSIKDLGGKESFAIVLAADSSADVVKALRDSFDARWRKSKPL
ncbi:MAG: hypothetical protein WBB22_17950 [Anaerolineae bacterium]